MKDKYGNPYGLPKYVVLAGLLALPLAFWGQDNIWLIISAFSLLIPAVILEMLNLRKVYKLEVQRFEQRKRTTNQEFLGELKLVPNTDIAQVTLTVRKVLAEYANGVSPDCVSSNLIIPDDFGILFDSLDILGLIFVFEKKLNIKIPNTNIDKFWPYPRESNEWTVKDFVFVILNLYEKQHFTACPKCNSRETQTVTSCLCDGIDENGKDVNWSETYGLCIKCNAKLSKYNPHEQWQQISDEEWKRETTGIISKE